ncbi:MAG TPA: M20/M25/M40 family metallo-hydrolase [Steroidobacteraceae bacterium]|jgi:acetylornithine deacetylase/succinyl-diaminopimelate desuccinylase-like protein|nr:M20/M25/M40 family metallo-hydrolase [Steroidobacteraceae bacterium]
MRRTAILGPAMTLLRSRPAISPLRGRAAPVLLAAVSLLILGSAARAADLDARVDDYRRQHEAAIVGKLDDLTRLKSIAADPAGLQAAADRLQGWLRERGFDTEQWKSSSGGPPAVFGSLPARGAKRTVVFYAHYDGQPVTPSQWSSDPFVPVVRTGLLGTGEHEIDWKSAKGPFDPGWRFYARAVSDDKATIIAFLTAFDALKAAHRAPSVNVKVLWEGEEEAGSPHLGDILRTHRAELSSDLMLIGDGPVHQSRKPMIYFGARGVIGLDATLYGPVRALHDGHYGNWVPNPAAMAASLLAEMRDDTGKITIPGFADGIRALNDGEQAALAHLPPVDDALKAEFGIARAESDETLAKSLMRPALNVRGIRAGQVGESAANAIPTTAAFSLDFRLVPDQRPAAVRASVERFLQDHGWTVLADEPTQADRRAHARLIRLQWEPGYPAFRADLSAPSGKAVIAAASKAAHGSVVIMPMMGGSVPLYEIAEIVRVPVIGLPIANHDNNQHAANENLRLQNLWDGIDAYAAMLSELRW